MNIGHKKSEIELQKILSLLSGRHRLKVYDGKQQKVPYREGNERCHSRWKSEG
jgi:hypothetical protein